MMKSIQVSDKMGYKEGKRHPSLGEAGYLIDIQVSLMLMPWLLLWVFREWSNYRQHYIPATVDVLLALIGKKG